DLPRNSLRASAYAAGTAIASDSAVVARPTFRDCTAAPHHEASLKNFAYRASENERGGNSSSCPPPNDTGMTMRLGSSRKREPHHASAAPARRHARGTAHGE